MSAYLVITGFVFWTLAEYLMHRYLFHGEDTWMKYIPLNKWVYTGHFCMHGIHHAFPQDATRLVFPPFPGYWIIGIFVYSPITLSLPYWFS